MAVAGSRTESRGQFSIVGRRLFWYAITPSAWVSSTPNPTRYDGAPMTKYIFITGGVVSSLGKGITAASSTVFFGLCFRWIKNTVFSESFTLKASTPATQR